VAGFLRYLDFSEYTLELTQSSDLSSISASIGLIELFEACAVCRKNKRSTMNAIAFEVDYDRELLNLWEDIHSGRYQHGQMGKSRMKSDETTKSAGYCAVFGFNLRQLARYVAGEVRPKSEEMAQIAAKHLRRRPATCSRDPRTERDLWIPRTSPERWSQNVTITF